VGYSVKVLKKAILFILLVWGVNVFSILIAQASALPTFNTDDPAVLHVSNAGMVRLDVSPQQAIYKTMPNISVIYRGNKNITVQWQAQDGFGKMIASGNIKLSGHLQSYGIKLPTGHGYYALTLRSGEDNQHYSFGVLPVMRQKQPDIFGVWVQGVEAYDRLGVSWTRLGIYYSKWHENKKYKKHLHMMLSELKKRGISVLLYPKEVPKKIRVNRKLIRDDRDAWNVFQKWLTEMVREFDGEAGAWGVINEPFAYVGRRRVPNDITLRYWTTMRPIIDKYSPDTPLIGPCLNVHQGAQLRQYRELIRGGFGKLVDGIELHTYMRNVSFNGKKFKHAMPEDIDWYDRMHHALLDAGDGKIKHDIWITEMGMPANYEQELQQATFVTRSALWAKYMQGNGVPVRMLNWHAFSFPQGRYERARKHSLFRNVKANRDVRKKKNLVPQARPAAIAYGIAIRHLNGATFVRQWDDLPAHTYVFEFKNKGKKVIALWATDTSVNIRLSKQARQGVLSDMFGKQLLMPQHGNLQLNHKPLWIEY